MAIKITTEGLIRTIKPNRASFELRDLEFEVGGSIEPVKIGPVWVIYSEQSKEVMPRNSVASSFFEVAIYGDVMVVPPQQLPHDWDIMDEEDYKYTAEEVDEGFILSLQRSLLNTAGMPFHAIANNFPNPFAYIEEFLYKPPHELAADDTNTRDFYRQICEKPINVEKLSREGIILEDPGVVIRVKEREDRLIMINQMIQFYIETEEYEMCAKLQKVKADLEITNC